MGGGNLRGSLGYAVIILIIAAFGLFGQEEDPLSGVFLLPLGLPWVLWTHGLRDTFRPITAVLAPLINFVILNFLCRTLTREPIVKK